MLVMTTSLEKDSQLASDKLVSLAAGVSYVTGFIVEVVRGGSLMHEVRAIWDCAPGPLQPGQRKVTQYVVSKRDRSVTRYQSKPDQLHG